MKAPLGMSPIEYSSQENIYATKTHQKQRIGIAHAGQSQSSFQQLTCLQDFDVSQTRHAPNSSNCRVHFEEDP